MSAESTKKVAIVTGGSRGIGRAIVDELVATGHHVVVADINIDGLSANGQALSFEKLDVTNVEACNALMEKVVKDQGSIDVLVNNAGVTRDGLLMRMSEADWDLVLNINLKGVFNVTKAAIRPMMSQKRGKIINIASVVGISGNPGQANYCASKAGVIGFTKSVAKEVASRGICVNAVAPGYIETDMTAKLNDAQREAMLTIVPMKRAGKPEDVARVVGFLASQAADYVTGQ